MIGTAWTLPAQRPHRPSSSRPRRPNSESPCEGLIVSQTDPSPHPGYGSCSPAIQRRWLCPSGHTGARCSPGCAGPDSCLIGADKYRQVCADGISESCCSSSTSVAPNWSHHIALHFRACWPIKWRALEYQSNPWPFTGSVGGWEEVWLKFFPPPYQLAVDFAKLFQNRFYLTKIFYIFCCLRLVIQRDVILFRFLFGFADR